MTSPTAQPPSHPGLAGLFDPVELEILRRFAGLPCGTIDESGLLEPAGSDLLDEEDEPEPGRGPVRLTRAELNTSDFPGGDIQLAEATARLCLGRKFARVLRPRHLCTINWDDSGPGGSWPEAYHVTWLPPLGRHVVTMACDSTEVWGCTGLALDSFGQDEPMQPACERILHWWWAFHRDLGREEPWSAFWKAGLMDREATIRVRAAVWPGHHRPAFG
jgi:hypothetical protein